MAPRVWHLHAVSALLVAVVRGQEVTAGPLAYVSLDDRIEWSTARECAAACLKFNGIWVCGVNGGYYDLGVELECGCASINGCYCNTELASSASRYISSCVSSRCSDVGDLTRDLSNMMGLYDDYCKTARAEAADSNENAPRPNDGETKDAETTTTDEAASKPTDDSSDSPRQTSTSGAEPTVTGEESQGNNNSNDGLSRSDIVALAASLGVGIPSLLIAALTLYFQIRKKRRNAEANAARTNSLVTVLPVKQTRNGWES